MLGLVQKIIGSRNDRFVKKLSKTVEKVNSYESELEKFSDEEIKAKTLEFRERIAKGQSLDSLLPEAFAVVREASKRQRAFRPCGPSCRARTRRSSDARALHRPRPPRGIPLCAGRRSHGTPS